MNLRLPLGKDRLFLLFLLLWTTLFLGLRTLQHYSFGTNTFDLAIFDTMMHSTLHGEWMFEPFHGYWGSHLAVHFTPILFLLVPFYALFPGPLLLLYVQVLAGALSAWLLHRIARREFPAPSWVPGLVAGTFLLYRPFLSGLMYDFHPEMLFPLCILGSYYFLSVRKKPGLHFLAVTAALLIKEDMPLYVFFYGLFLFFRLKDDRKTGLFTAGYALAYFFLVIQVVIPHLRAQLPVQGGYEFSNLWGAPGAGILEMAREWLAHPRARLSSLPWPTVLPKFFNLLSALLFLPFLSGFMLIALVPALVLATSSSPVMSGFGLHYIAGLLPFLFLGVLDAFKTVGRWTASKNRLRRTSLVLALGLLVVNLANTKWNLLSPSRYAALREYSSFRECIRDLPRKAPVAAQSALIPHLPKRKNIRMLPGKEGAEYILLHGGVNLWPFTREEFDVFLRDLEQGGEYEEVCRRGGTRLFKKSDH